MVSLFLLSVPYFALMILFFSLVLYFANIVQVSKIHLLPFAYLVLLFYVTLWGLISGGLVIGSFSDPKFYGGEGRIYLAYLPIFLAFLIPVSFYNQRNVFFLFRILLGLAVCLAPIWASGNMELLFGSHHANGYASANILIVFISLYITYKKKWMAIGIFIAILMLMFANSRTAILGLAIAFAAFYRHSILKPKFVLVAGLGLAMILVIWPLVSPSSFQRVTIVFQAETWRAIGQQFAIASALPDPTVQEAERVGKQYNILTRINLYAKAVWFFEQSPILGIGSFRYNDLLPDLNQIVPFLVISHSDSPEITTATAHNSFLHVLAEGGVVGLTFYMLPWIVAIKLMAKNSKKGRVVISTSRIGILSSLFLMFGALTGHLLASPSGTLWSTFVVGIAIQVSRNYERTQNTHLKKAKMQDENVESENKDRLLSQ